MYNNVNETVKKPTLLATVLGACNLAVALPLVIIGVLGIILYKAFGVKKENQRLQTANEALKTEVERLEYDDFNGEDEEFEPYDEPLNNGTPTVEQPLNPTVEPTVEPAVVSIVEPTVDDEAFNKEMIRRTMSELGKRSAEKRRTKKEEREEGL
ncbi:MAG: hypothetical protein GY793_00155 [Proteobacteria bacterium]|nr:hypothetical protein [Pseudomonadota bacterium]